jgi:putative DNA primase/helicase
MADIIPFSATEPEKPAPVEFTEDSQVKLFVDKANDTLRYVDELDQWINHNGNYWEEVSKLAIIEVVRQLNRESALELQKDMKLARSLSTKRFSASVESWARGDRQCLLSVDELDKDPWLLGTEGGIIDLRTGQYIDKGQRPYVTMVTAVAPADVADKSTCPRFLEFMDQFTCGDASLKRYLLQYAGYCLTGDMREQCLLFLYGDGDNGKTVFIQLLRNLLGGYAMTAPIELFVTAGVGKHLTGFAAMHRKRCVIANETQKGHVLRMDVIKGITGQDLMRANFMRKDTFEFLPVCKLVMFGNHKPNLPNVGKAERKRIRMIPCELQLAQSEIDRGLPERLQAEGPGILRALINGCLDWQREGLVEPDCVKEHTANYFDGQDQFRRWLEACCIKGFDKQERTAVLWNSWRLWAKENQVEAGTETSFAENLTEAGFKYDKNLKFENGKARGWKGLEMAKGGPGADQEIPF